MTKQATKEAATNQSHQGVREEDMLLPIMLGDTNYRQQRREAWRKRK